MADTKELLDLAVELGENMLKNGAEIYRVQDTITMIMKAYKVEDFDVYVLSNGIFASANEVKADSGSIIRHVPLGDVDLAKISGFNQIARDLCDKTCSLDEARTRINEVATSNIYPKWLLILCCGIGSGAFGYLFGGTVADALISVCLGAFEEILLIGMKKVRISKFIQIVFASAIVCISTLLILRIAPSLQGDKIIIGSIMPLVPGIAFTTAIRDFYNQDHLSGTIHLINALLIALCIAVGICIPMLAYNALFGGALL